MWLKSGGLRFRGFKDSFNQGLGESFFLGIPIKFVSFDARHADLKVSNWQEACQKLQALTAR